MNKCPHCGAHANPLRLMTMTRRRPYRCGGCGKTSLLQPRHNTVVALFTLAAVVVCALYVAPRSGAALAVATFAGLYCGIGLVMLFFMKLASTNRE